MGVDWLQDTEPFPEVQHCTQAWDSGFDKDRRVIKVDYEHLKVKYIFVKAFKRNGRKEVWRCRQRILDQAAGRWVAGDDVVIKCDTAKWITNEIKTLHFLSHPGHPNIVPLLHSFICTTDPDRLYMVMPYYPNGDLLDLVNRHLADRTQLTNEDLADLFVPLYSAIEYCHKLGVAHMDISPENVWFDADGQPCLGDFDAVWLPPALYPPSPLIQCSWRHGKSSFMAPQMVLLQPLDPFAADVFSLGSTIFTAAAKCYLLKQVDVRDPQAMVSRPCYQMLTQNPLQGSYRLVEKVTSNVGANMCPMLKDLVAKMTCCDPSRRLTLEGVKRHGWFQMYGTDMMDEVVDPLDDQSSQDLGDGLKMALYQRKESVEAA